MPKRKTPVRRFRPRRKAPAVILAAFFGVASSAQVARPEFYPHIRQEVVTKA